MYALLDLWDTLYLIRVFSFNSVYITAPNKIPGTPENSEGQFTTQLTFTCSNSAVETLKEGVKYNQNEQ